VRCLGCGRVRDLPLSVDTRVEELAGRAMNYRILGHTLEVHGLCPSCREDDAEQPVTIPVGRPARLPAAHA
jgi:Fe2+ or Zn2+ uptake regulation protein